MDLDQPVSVRRRAVDDEEDEVLVVIDLRPLVEVFRILDRERVKLEDVAQDLEIGDVRAVQIKPEELVGREQIVDRLPRKVDNRAAVLAEYMALGGARRAVGESGTRDDLRRPSGCRRRQGSACSAV
jgi:hypothetical protein